MIKKDFLRKNRTALDIEEDINPEYFKKRVSYKMFIGDPKNDYDEDNMDR
jgi:hypothetical protein